MMAHLCDDLVTITDRLFSDDPAATLKEPKEADKMSGNPVTGDKRGDNAWHSFEDKKGPWISDFCLWTRTRGSNITHIYKA